MTAHRLEVEPGVSLQVVETGAGRPVVLLAGFGLDHEVWEGTMAALDGRHRVVAVDLRGTGGSDKPAGGYEMARLALDVAAVLDELDLAQVALVGYSLGGQVALQLAAAAPRRLDRLVLVCSNGVRATRSDAFPFGPPADKLEAALVAAELADRPAARRANVRSAFATEPSPAVVGALVAAQLRMPSSAAIPCYHTYLQTDLTAELATVKLPVLQILGDRDPVTPVAGAAWVQARLARSRLVVLDECGHYPMFEAKARFEAALLGFLPR